LVLTLAHSQHYGKWWTFLREQLTVCKQRLSVAAL
jgi:hypothetical protein